MILILLRNWNRSISRRTSLSSPGKITKKINKIIKVKLLKLQIFLIMIRDILKPNINNSIKMITNLSFFKANQTASIGISANQISKPPRVLIIILMIMIIIMKMRRNRIQIGINLLVLRKR